MMNRETPKNGRKNNAGNDIETLYRELIAAFYDRSDRRLARKIAGSLETALANQPEFTESIRAQEIRSLIAELRGDLAEAARCRECEIRKILELHSLAGDKRTKAFVMRQYDFSDVSDRLDLLAILYAEQKQYDRAVETLLESRAFCKSHGVKFDGQDLLREYERKGGKQGGGDEPTKRRKARLAKKRVSLS